MQLSFNTSGSDFDIPDRRKKLAAEDCQANSDIESTALLKPQIESDLDRELAIEHNKRAHINYDLHNYPAALVAIDLAIEYNPERNDFYYQRAVIAKALNNYPQVLVDCEEILNRDPHNRAAWRLKAVALVRTKNYPVAIVSFDRHIKLYPQDPDGYCYRGICYSQLKEYHRALNDFNTALELKPGEPVFHHARGRTYQKLGNLSAALADYDLVIQTTAIVKKVYDDRAEIYRLQGAYPKAIADCTQAIAFNPDRIDAYFRRAIIYAELGDLDLALIDYDRIISLESQHIRTYIQRSWIYFRQNKYLLAGEDCESALKIDKYSFWANYLLGVINNLSGLKERAIDNFTKAIEVCPNDIAARYHRGVIYYELGNMTKSTADFTHAKSIQDRSLEELVIGGTSTLENRDETGFYAEALALNYQGHKQSAIAILNLGLLVTKRFNNTSFKTQILLKLQHFSAE